jgi:hypothetical protein
MTTPMDAPTHLGPNIVQRCPAPVLPRGDWLSVSLILVAIGLPRSPALADDASALIGRWLVPSREQEKSKMSPHCQRYAETDVQTVPESEIEIFSCDDPAFAAQKARILDFVKSVNEVYRAQTGRLFRDAIGAMRSRARDNGKTEDRSL